MTTQKTSAKKKAKPGAGAIKTQTIASGMPAGVLRARSAGEKENDVS